MGAVADGVQQIINVGCGSDTRAYRFEGVLRRERVSVLECDQLEAIYAKHEAVKRWGPFEYVEYLPVDLNHDTWPEFERWLSVNTRAKVLLLMEGVSPYIDENAFRGFLSLLSNHLPAGSQVAYDFKLRGADDGFGRGRTRIPFRLSAVRAEVAAFHEELGLRLEHMELSSELSERLLPCLTQSTACVFREDGLVRLRVRMPPSSS